MRIDDFKNAIKLTAQELAQKDPGQIAGLAGVEYDPSSNQLKFDFCGRGVLVTWPEVTLAWADAPEAEFSLTDGVLVLHYLNGAQAVPLSGEFVAYRQIPGGEFYFAAFNRRAEIPLAKTFGHNSKFFNEAAAKFGGKPIEGYGDWAAIFRPLPLLPVILSGYEGDDEFEPTGQALFDKSIQHYLHIEDVSWLASSLAYRVIGYAGELSKR